jgi:hypothetical protein
VLALADEEFFVLLLALLVAVGAEFSFGVGGGPLSEVAVAV